MDWLRRNWPDLLIGIALVAVIAGIIATLITGGSFFPVGQSTQTSTPPAQSSTTQSSAQPATSSPSTSSATSTPSSGSTSSGTAASGGSASGSSQASTSGSNASGSASNGASSGTGSSASASSSGGVAVLPPSGGTSSSASSNGNASSASSGATSSGSAASGSTTTANAAPPASSSSASSAGSSASAAPAASASAGNGPGAAAPYRISVGAFSHPDYAKRREQLFKQAGYPAFLASQGDLTIVLVGPYRTQSEADSVASKIKNGGFGVDPVVYEFKGTQDSAPPPASASAGGSVASSGAASASSASGTSSSASGASAPAGQHYLQVGAYGTAASAKPQRDRLTSMGFQVTERNEGGLVKLLIGPFGASKLQQVESQLKAAGIDSFPR